MASLFALLTIASLILFIIGLAKPSNITFFGKNPSRLKNGLILGTLTFVFGMIWLAIAFIKLVDGLGNAIEMSALNPTSKITNQT